MVLRVHLLMLIIPVRPMPFVSMLWMGLFYVGALQATLVMGILSAVILTSALNNHIHVPKMLHVATQMVHTLVYAMPATLEMDFIVIGMNATLSHIRVHPMLHAPTQLAHTLVLAILVTLGME